ncbi:ATP-binding protein [Luteolibacter flavescens]|uniref:ATP-binding protein n=1 Tax=Luteolibacter flavescens TaxID=1859460 RepID=A0ABT3FVU7_9BACT|nr:ATP-binding protein [Luteolibacter flavescens]MCW1887694.1 ATP-binding protein [Luteolibacter flavescens]
MSYQHDIDRQKAIREAKTAGGRDAASILGQGTEGLRQDAAATGPLCGCGAPVDATLLEIRQWFPSLSPDLCSACYEAAERESAARVEEETELAERRHRLARLDATIPPEMLETRTGHVAFNGALWLLVCEWTPATRRWLLITGLPGRCKTRVVSLLAKQMIMDGVRLVWTTAIELQVAVEDLRSNHHGTVEAARVALREWKHAAVLVLDDLGKNTWTPSLEARLFELIDHRKTRLLPTIITANTPLAELLRTKAISVERGGPIIGRILEASRGWNIEAPEIGGRRG